MVLQILLIKFRDQALVFTLVGAKPEVSFVLFRVRSASYSKFLPSSAVDGY